MSLTDYLAKNYLTADPAPQKSKKRKRKDPKPGLSIADDDLTGWNANSADGDVDDKPTTASGRTSEFRKAKQQSWKAVGAPAPKDSEQAAADAILASAAAERDARAAENEAEDAPQMVEEEDSGPAMESGAKAGLQSAASVTAAMERKAAEERRRYAQDPASSGKDQETIYRDASGRIINVAMKRAEARKAAEEAERKMAEDAEALKGDVQRVEKAKRKQDLQDAKYMTLSRYADDAELNEELKDRDRWNDPAAQFLTKKKECKSVTGKPLYKGSFAPNRYGIRPGYRWDGVDRGNGFEKEYFKKKNEQESIKNLRYQWEMDE